MRLVRFFTKKVLFGTPSNSPQGGELKISSFLRKQWFYMFQQVLWLQNHWFYMRRQWFYMQKYWFYVQKYWFLRSSRCSGVSAPR